MYRRHLKHSRVKNLFKFVSAKMNTVFTVESSLEFDTCFHLEYSSTVKEFETQPLGKVRTSIPRTKNENFSHLISMGYQ